MSNDSSTLRTTAGRTGGPGRRARVFTGALAIAALLAALMAFWQAEFGPPARSSYCWGTWPEDGGPFRSGDHDRSAQESAPAPGRPYGTCTLSWRGGRGAGAYRQRLDVRYGTGPREAEARRAWLSGLLVGGDSALPDGLPGFVAAGSGTLVLPPSCDVDGRPSVVTVTSSFRDANGADGSGRTDGTDGADAAGPGGADRPGFPDDSSPARTGSLLVDAANRAVRASRCAPVPVVQPQHAPPSSVRVSAGGPAEQCAIPGLTVAAADSVRLTDTVGSVGDDFQTCAVAADDRWAARFAMIARPRVVALFDGLAGDGPPAPGWRAHGRIEASGALVQADCAGRPTVFTMRTGPGRSRTRLDDARAVFPDFVDAVGRRIGCASLHTGRTGHVE
ncbi:hypothetical protein [Streptomyces sp. NPDC001404]|uniref:hypothetical protein n=1 Tax=Streptomyces sp. NPDC001404 TaxID=3364571 RepID=UPI00368759AA